MPPEFWNNGFCETYTTTVWALGCLLFKMVTGVLPYPRPANCLCCSVDLDAYLNVDDYIKRLIMVMLSPVPRSRITWLDLCKIFLKS